MKKKNKNVMIIAIGILALFLLMVFSGNFLVVEKMLTKSQADAIMAKYNTQGYLCGSDSGSQIKYTDCSLYQWTTGVNIGTYQIDCENYDYVSCGTDQLPVTHVWCLVGDSCISVTGTSCSSGATYSTGTQCILAKSELTCEIPSVTTQSYCNDMTQNYYLGKNSCTSFDLIDCIRNIPVTTTQKITTTTIPGMTTTTSIGTTTTSSTTTTTECIGCNYCADHPLDPSCYDCKSYQEVKNGQCTTTFKSMLAWIRNWFVGLFS
jgi:hypothetical protein